MEEKKERFVKSKQFGKRIGGWVKDKAPEIALYALAGLAGWGASDILWRLIGGHAFERDLWKAEGYCAGYSNGLKAKAKLDSIANGTSEPEYVDPR